MGVGEVGRRGAVGAAGVVAIVVALGSVAMACIPYKGKMEVKGMGAGATSTEVIGAGSGMRYCQDEEYGPSARLPNPNGTGTFRVKVKPNAKGECASQLLAGDYGVRWWSGSATELTQSRNDFKCFPWNEGSVKVGDLLVDIFGNGQGVYPIPAGAQPGYGAVCLVNKYIGSGGGNRAPVMLL